MPKSTLHEEHIAGLHINKDVKGCEDCVRSAGIFAYYERHRLAGTNAGD